MSVAYRVRQFGQAIVGPQTPPDLGQLASLLTPQQAALFSAMAVLDQRHCLAVAAALAAGGQNDPDLLRAALVHDAGKSLAPIGVWERVTNVLMRWLTPGLVGRVGSPREGGFGHGLYLLAHHSGLGAALAQRAGFSPATVALVRGDGDPALQEALDQADNTH
jgi:hypothetical protein